MASAGATRMRRRSLLSFLRKRYAPDQLNGVHVGDGAVSYARVRRDRAHTPELVSCGASDAGSDSEISSVIRSFREQTEPPPARASCVLADAEYQLLLVEAPDVEPAELKAAVRWRIKDLIDFHIDDAVIDVFDVPGDQSRSPMKYVVAARSATVARRVEQLETAGMGLEYIDVAELALRNVAALTEEDVAGLALLHLEPDYGLMTVTRQGALYLARRIEIGHSQLERAYRADDGSADRLLDNVLLELQRSLDYYESHFDQAGIGSVYVTPQPTEMPAMIDYMRERLGVRVGQLDLRELITCNVDCPPERQARTMLALGGALRTEQMAL